MYKFLIPITAIIVLLNSCKEKEVYIEPQIAQVTTPIMQYGFDLNNYQVLTDTVKPGDTFSNIIQPYLPDNQSIFIASQQFDSIYSVRKIRAGKPIKILKRKDSVGTTEAFIYEPSSTDYVVLKLADSIKAYKDKHPIKIVKKTASGVITSTLSEAMQDQGLGINAIYQLSDIYRWSIDFFRLQQGDRFKMIYTERYVNDSIYAGIEHIQAAVFETDNNPYYAFNYTTDTIANISDYYDDQGKTLRSFFLKAPVNYTRISSRYTKRRFHPVQKRWKAHKGTDYAAAYGTPIVATANGVVIKSSYTRGNGNYVKIKHNNTYTTQYLHMTKRKVTVGQRVKQGQVIGTVGSTGLATGPHVCYRFWVNGKQVDPYKQNLPSADPLPKDQLEHYYNFIQPLKKEIDSLPFKNNTNLL